MLAYFLKINVAIAYFMRSTGYFSIKTRSSRGAEPLCSVSLPFLPSIRY